MSYLNCSYILALNCFTSIFYFFLLLIFELLEIAQGYLGFCKLKISCLPQNTDMKLIQFYHLPQCYALLGYFVRKLFERCSVYRTKMGYRGQSANFFLIQHFLHLPLMSISTQEFAFYFDTP